MRIRNVASAGVVCAALVLSACSPDAPAQKTVWGERDDIKHVDKVTKKVTEQKYKRVCARRSKGKCKSYKRIKDGTRTYSKTVAPEAWCVELDNVNGAAKNDDVWYATTQLVYLKAQRLSEGDIIKFKPIHGGCW